jgi:hypothetical protein
MHRRRRRRGTAEHWHGAGHKSRLVLPTPSHRPASLSVTVPGPGLPCDFKSLSEPCHALPAVVTVSLPVADSVLAESDRDSGDRQFPGSLFAARPVPSPGPDFSRGMP